MKTVTLRRAVKRYTLHSMKISMRLKWFTNVRANNRPVSGPILQTQADEFVKSLGYTDFHCSNGSVDRFRKRHNIVFRKICGEARAIIYRQCMNGTKTNSWISSMNINLKISTTEMKQPFSIRCSQPAP